MSRTDGSPLLRIVAEVSDFGDGVTDDGLDGIDELVSVERVDGLLSLTRCRRGPGPWRDASAREDEDDFIPQETETTDPYVAWFKSDWENIGVDTI